MRSNLSYTQASQKANRVANAAFAKAELEGKSLEERQIAARSAYEAEMKWYEGE
jgi:hypothetical protein